VLVGRDRDHDEPELRGLGRSFIAWPWQRAKDELVEPEHVRLLAPPRRQVNHIDILNPRSILRRYGAG
jgi:hypothetical protein